MTTLGNTHNTGTDNDIGIVKSVQGKITAVSENGSTRILHVGDHISATDRLFTAPDSSITITFNDHSNHTFTENLNGISLAVGVIANTHGEITIIEPDGTTRILHPGDPIYFNDSLKIPDEGSAEIIFTNGAVKTFTQSSLHVTDETMGYPINQSHTDIATIQQAILSGADPSVIGEQAAAGTLDIGNGDRTFVDNLYLYPQALPDAGFPTTGIHFEETVGPQHPFWGAPIQEVDLSIVKTVNCAYPDVCDTISYTLTVSNAPNEGTAQNVVVTDVIPTGEIVRDISNGGNFDPLTDTITWNLGSVSSGETIVLTYDATINPDINFCGAINTAVVSTTSFDANLENNTSSLTIFPRADDDIICKFVSCDHPHVGQCITYTIDVTNGESDDDCLSTSRCTTVIDKLPNGIIVVPNSITGPGYYDPHTNTITWKLGDLRVGSTDEIQYKAVVTECADPCGATNTAKVCSYTYDINHCNNTATSTVYVQKDSHCNYDNTNHHNKENKDMSTNCNGYDNDKHHDDRDNEDRDEHHDRDERHDDDHHNYNFNDHDDRDDRDDEDRDEHHHDRDDRDDDDHDEPNFDFDGHHEKHDHDEPNFCFKGSHDRDDRDDDDDHDNHHHHDRDGDKDSPNFDFDGHHGRHDCDDDNDNNNHHNHDHDNDDHDHHDHDHDHDRDCDSNNFCYKHCDGDHNSECGPRDDLSICKSVSCDHPEAYQTVTYNLEVGNGLFGGECLSTSHGTTVVDHLPEGIIVEPCSISNGGQFDPDSDTITWNLGDLQVGSKDCLQYNAQVTACADPCGATNTATVSSFNYDVNPCNNTASATVYVKVDEDSICKTVSCDHPTIGECITYKLDVQNGDGDCDDKCLSTSECTKVVDCIPKGIDVDPCSISNNGYYDACKGTITWNLGNLCPGQHECLTFNAKVNECADPCGVTNFSTISSKTFNADPCHDTSCVTIYPQVDEDSICKTVSCDHPGYGDCITYTLHVQNGDGDCDDKCLSTSKDTVVVDCVPKGIDVEPNSISDGGCFDPCKGTITWHLGDLEVGEKECLTFNAKVDECADPCGVTNCAAVTSCTFNIEPCNAKSCVTIYPEPKFDDDTICKTVSCDHPNIGECITYKLDVKNGDNDCDDKHLAVSKDTVVVDCVPKGIDVDPCSISNNGYYDACKGTITWNLGDLCPGQHDCLTFNAKVDECASPCGVTNCATVSSCTPDIDPCNNKSCVTIYPQVDEDSICKTVSCDHPNIGECITYKLDVKNGDNDCDDKCLSPSKDTVVVDCVPKGIEVDPCSISNNGYYDACKGTITWNLGDLCPGQHDCLTFNAKVDPCADPCGVTNSATVSSCTFNIEPCNATSCVTIYPQVDEDTISKSVSCDHPFIGDCITYTLDVQNGDGDCDDGCLSTSKDTVVVDCVPQGLDVNPDSISNDGYFDPCTRTITWNLGDLCPGQHECLTFDAKVDECASPCGVTNTAKVTSCTYDINHCNTTSCVEIFPREHKHCDDDNDHGHKECGNRDKGHDHDRDDCRKDHDDRDDRHHKDQDCDKDSDKHDNKCDDHHGGDNDHNCLNANDVLCFDRSKHFNFDCKGSEDKHEGSCEPRSWGDHTNHHEFAECHTGTPSYLNPECHTQHAC